MNILSGGAAQGLVAACGAVQGRDRLRDRRHLRRGRRHARQAARRRAGRPADPDGGVIAELAAAIWVVPASAADIGLVETAVAVAPATRSGSAIRNLREALLAADAIFFPTQARPPASISPRCWSGWALPTRSRARLRPFPTARPQCASWRPSATADRLHAGDRDRQHAGRDPVALTAPGLDLATVYTAAVAAQADQAPQAQRLIDLLISTDQREVRTRARLSRRRVVFKRPDWHPHSKTQPVNLDSLLLVGSREDLPAGHHSIHCRGDADI